MVHISEEFKLYKNIDLVDRIQKLKIENMNARLNQCLQQLHFKIQ